MNVRRAPTHSCSYLRFVRAGIVGWTDGCDFLENSIGFRECPHTGVAVGTVYLYFGSKEHLLAALRDRHVDELLAHVSDLLSRAGQGDWWALVDTTIESMADFMIENADLEMVFLEEGLSSDVAKVLPDVGSRVDAMFAAAIQQGIDAGACRASDPEFMATFFHHAFEGALMHACFHGDPVDRDRFVAAAKELVHKALAP